MAKYNLILPRMGESVSEATIVKWLKQPGDWIEVDDSVVDIATDKVDSDVPSPVEGKLIEQLFTEDSIAQVGDVIAILEVEGERDDDASQSGERTSDSGYSEPAKGEDSDGADVIVDIDDSQQSLNVGDRDSIDDEEGRVIPGLDLLGERGKGGRFYSPLVKNIAAEEGISEEELDQITGSGLEGRVTKQDILNYIDERKDAPVAVEKAPISETVGSSSDSMESKDSSTRTMVAETGDEIIEMDRMRKLIAQHMVDSVQTSPHVCSFIEVDVTNIVNWRSRVKEDFEKKEGVKITFTPIFIEAVAKAIRDYPMINISVSGTQIIKKGNINVGMAAALPSGNLIVPVIRNADQLNLVGLSQVVNDLAGRARANRLKPDETQGGTFTVTNVGSFGSMMGTPIINQPQVAILAIGSIGKKPAVLETEYGDVIAIRQKMIMSLSYDHRVVDGALGGMFLKRIAEYLEGWDIDRKL
ncbi:dihydrolipoamide acetyltransferase family protein [Albibacterium indicum]|uniref:dihydrolipoamide acetyltransferase family protein n=1 Tax=Albibacterium indicum TaxID=2292082 RepID=UPI000E4A6636|nr:dihydrolipoamide acetyltransferase family protein [Pedobacter indicus]